MCKFIYLLLFLVSGTLYSQNSLNRSSLPSEFKLWDIRTDKEPMPSVKYKAGFCLAQSLKSGEILLYGITGPDQIILLQRLPYNGKFNPQLFVRCIYEKGQVYLCSTVKNKAEEICATFEWRDQRSLIFKGDQSTDPNIPMLKRAENYLKEGKIKDAIVTYDSVSYAESYYNSFTTGLELIKKSEEQIQLLKQQNKTKEIADLTGKVLKWSGNSWLKEINSQEQLQSKLLKQIITPRQLSDYFLDYIGSLVKMRQYDEAINACNIWGKPLVTLPDYTLLKADAYYGKRDKSKYPVLYSQYCEMMKSLKKEKDIPSYIQTRLN
jgi:hypothetical protein